MGSMRRFALLVAPAFVALACNAVLGLDDLPLKDAGSGDGGDPGLGGTGGSGATAGKGGSAGRGGTVGSGGSSTGGDAGEGGESGASGGSGGSDPGGRGGSEGGGSGGTGGTSGAGGDTGGSGGTAGQSGSSGSAGSGGTCDLSDVGKSREALPNPITGAFTATADKVWTLNDYVVVEDGGELTIEPCTRIEGAAAGNPGTLFIARGAKIFANGTATHPILFTSEASAPNRAAGQWGGVVLLGRAPITVGSQMIESPFEAITDSRLWYGGSLPADNSGSLSYVRIEFSGHVIQENFYAIAGLALAGVGSGTTIDHVMVSNTRDDCFDWFGGTVRSNYLVCNNPADDYFDIDAGWLGGGEYWFGRREHAAIESGDPYGIEADATNDLRAPRTDFDVTNAILCGTGQAVTTAQPQFGMVLRERVRADIVSLLLLGFEYGIDTRDAVDAADISISDSAFWDLVNPGGIGDPDTGGNDDVGFLDQTPFESGTFNSQPDPGFFTVSECLDPNGPTSAVTNDDYWRWLEEDWLDWSTE
jgi:hypothetical protein